MSNHPNRKNILFVVTGIFIGLLLGGMFGWWIKPVEIVRNIMTPVKNFSFLSKLGFHKNDSTSLKHTISYPTSSYSKYSYMTKDTSGNPDTTNFDTKYPDVANDSLGLADENVDGVYDNSITVKKDMLLFVKDIEMLIKTNAKDKMLDSLLTDEESATPKKTMRVEFWQSPINYHGYTFSTNKLTIFGIYDVEETYFVNYNNVVYLKNGFDVYQLEPTIDFKPLRKVNNPTIIKLLTTR